MKIFPQRKPFSGPLWMRWGDKMLASAEFNKAVLAPRSLLNALDVV